MHVISLKTILQKTERKAKTTELNAKEIVKTEVMTEEVCLQSKDDLYNELFTYVLGLVFQVAATSQWSNNDQTTKELDGAKIKQEFKDASVSEISDAAKSGKFCLTLSGDSFLVALP